MMNKILDKIVEVFFIVVTFLMTNPGLFLIGTLLGFLLINYINF